MRNFRPMVTTGEDARGFVDSGLSLVLVAVEALGGCGIGGRSEAVVEGVHIGARGRMHIAEEP